MEFEYDAHKSESNKRKDGVDFIEAQALWKDSDRIEIPARTADDLRYLLIGKIGDEHWSAIFTYRDQKIRIISVRRTRREEIEIYEG